MGLSGVTDRKQTQYLNVIYEELTEKGFGVLTPLSKGTSFTHTKSHCLFSPLPLNKSKRYTTQVFFNPVTPSQITTGRILKSPEVKSLIV